MPIFWLKSKKSWIFFLLFLSSNIAPWVQAEWTNMCLNLVMQKIKKMNLFCLPEYSILIGHYETTGLRSIFTLPCEQYILLWCWSNSFVWHVYWFVNIPITVLVKNCTPCQGVVWFSPSKCHIFYITKFKHMFVHSAWTHGAMLELKNRKKKNPGFLDFNQKMAKTVAAKLVLTFLPYRLWTCHLSREK